MDLLDSLLPGSPQLGLGSSTAAPSPGSPRSRVSWPGTPPPVSARIPGTPAAQNRHRLLFGLRIRSCRLDGSPRSPCTTALSPRRFSARSRRRTCRSVMPSSSAACFCVISFFLAFFKATSRSRSACVISSCPSATSPAWRSSIGHFYFAQIGHYHFAPTNHPSIDKPPGPVYNQVESPSDTRSAVSLGFKNRKVYGKNSPNGQPRLAVPRAAHARPCTGFWPGQPRRRLEQSANSTRR